MCGHETSSIFFDEVLVLEVVLLMDMSAYSTFVRGRDVLLYTSTPEYLEPLYFDPFGTHCRFCFDESASISVIVKSK